MTFFIADNILDNPKQYIEDIYNNDFQSFVDGENVFKNIQPRGDDEFVKKILSMFDGYGINFNFVRKSPLNQLEPNYMHTDEMMGDITCLLYLNEEHPDNDGTTIYDDNKKPLFTIYSKLNRMFAFTSSALHSRNILENFGEDKNARLVQVIFLKKLDDK
jgi:hypothetical protein